MKKTELFGEFSGISSKEWKQKIQSDLRGADYNETLIWHSPEGIPVKPFYHPDDIQHETLARIETPTMWLIGQIIYAGKAEKANAKALDAIHRGAESLVFIIPSEELDIKTLFLNLPLQTISIHLTFKFLSPKYITSILNSFPDAGTDIHIHTDIIGEVGRSGNWFKNFREDWTKLTDITAASQERNVISVDTSLYQNAGANMVQQLAYGLAHANEYLNGYHSENPSRHPRSGYMFKVSIGGNYFFEIAKLRALRLLWKSLSEDYGITRECHILALPSRRNKTIYDYNINMLRTTMESMAAILGGADTVCNLPYDALYQKDNEFGERIARNQLLILKNESYFDKVGNAAEGSYYIEKLTLQLAEKAMKLFKNIEAGGGFLEQLKEGIIQKKIRENALQGQRLFDESQEVLVGTNGYQNKEDKMKEALELHPFVKTNPGKTLVEPIIEKRLAEESEQIRLDNE